MCFDLDSHPPIAPIAGGAIDAGEVVLAADDGTRLRAFRARATTPSGAGIVILPDVRGLHHYYEELALRFAEAGVDAVAIDYFGRTAGVEPRPADFDHMSHVAQAQFDGLRADIRAGAAYLRSTDGGAVHALFTVGFCMGGRLAFVSAAMGLDLAGAIGFYGWPVGASRNGTPAPVDLAGEMRSPVLGLFGGADQGIPVSAAESFDAALGAAGVEHEVVVYPGAPHGFFDQKAAEFADQSAAAWEKTREFIAGHAGTGASAG